MLTIKHREAHVPIGEPGDWVGYKNCEENAYDSHWGRSSLNTLKVMKSAKLYI